MAQVLPVDNDGHDDGGVYARTVASLFANVFELDTVQLDDDFFQLGGDSLLAETLMMEIERQFEVAVPISVLMEASTPRALAAAVLEASRRRASPTLIAVRPDGDGPPLFCVHGLGGESMFPRRLIDVLQRQCPVYGFRAVGLEAGETPLISVQAIAGDYIVAMRSAWPAGPYLISGHCGGAVIAYEMTQQLLSIGERVAGLILIDPEIGDMAPFLYQSGLPLKIVQSAWERRGADVEPWLEAHPDASAEMRRKLVLGALSVACGSYSPTPYAGPTLLICSTERKAVLLNTRRGYPTLLRDLTIKEVEGEHKGMLDDRVGEVAQVIEPFLERVAPAGVMRGTPLTTVIE